MNLKIHFALIVCCWSILPAHSWLFRRSLPPELQNLNELTMEKIKDSEAITENLNMADASFVYIIDWDFGKLNNDMLFKLEMLINNIEKHVDKKKNVTELSSYQSYKGHLDDYRRKLTPTVVMKLIKECLSNNSNAFDPMNNDFEDNVDFLLYEIRRFVAYNSIPEYRDDDKLQRCTR